MNPKLISDPKIITEKDKRDTGEKNRYTNVRSSSVTATSKSDKERAATINTVVKALKFYSPATTTRGAVHFLPNGSNANGSEDSIDASAVTQIFDNNWDPILKPSCGKMRDKVINVAFSYTKLIP